MDPKLIDPSQLIERSGAGIVVHDAATKIIYANPAALRLLRLTEAQAVGIDAMNPQWRFLDAEGASLAHEDFPVNRIVAGLEVKQQVVGILDHRPNITWGLVDAYPVRNGGDQIERVVVTFVDITERHSVLPFEQIVSASHDAMTVVRPHAPDGTLRFEYVNPACCRLFGYTAAEMLGRPLEMLDGPDTCLATGECLRQRAQTEGWAREVVLSYRKDGARIWIDIALSPLRDNDGRDRYYATIQRDVTRERSRRSELETLAMQDPLTGLLNRKAFLDGAGRAFARAQMGDTRVVVAMLDLDHFKEINDQYGHQTGDEALVDFAARLRSSTRRDDLVGRVGGEEFAVLLPETDERGARQLFARLQAQLHEVPFRASDGTSIALTVSVGLSERTGSGSPLEAQLRVADQALYAAKAAGRNRIVTR